MGDWKHATARYGTVVPRDPSTYMYLYQLTKQRDLPRTLAPKQAGSVHLAAHQDGRISWNMLQQRGDTELATQCPGVPAGRRVARAGGPVSGARRDESMMVTSPAGASAPFLPASRTSPYQGKNCRAGSVYTQGNKDGACQPAAAGWPT